MVKWLLADRPVFVRCAEMDGSVQYVWLLNWTSNIYPQCTYEKKAIQRHVTFPVLSILHTMVANILAEDHRYCCQATADVFCCVKSQMPVRLSVRLQLGVQCSSGRERERERESNPCANLSHAMMHMHSGAHCSPTPPFPTRMYPMILGCATASSCTSCRVCM